MTIDVPLRFWHTYELEEVFDGAVIEISTDGGTSWLDLGDKILQGGYDMDISED